MNFSVYDVILFFNEVGVLSSLKVERLREFGAKVRVFFALVLLIKTF